MGMGKHVQDSAPGLAGNQDHLRLPLALSVRTGLPQVGLCMTFNRILNFHVVRSTRPCQFTPASSQSIRDRGALCSSALTGLIRARDGRGAHSEAPCPLIWWHVSPRRVSSARRNSAICGIRAMCSDFPTVDGLEHTAPRAQRCGSLRPTDRNTPTLAITLASRR